MLKLKHIKVEQTEHKTNEQPQKYHLRTASNSKCRGGGGEWGWSGGGGGIWVEWGDGVTVHQPSPSSSVAVFTI